ncbi:DUF7739 domain-containing protein [Streptomyces jumonjinensis]|uniref:DUF7739 domain-containing protein n=1 Tax=Streptomyces jumonjinensis TaxID=1945 RepID=UPI0037A22C4D
MLTLSHGTDPYGELPHSTERLHALAADLARPGVLPSQDLATVREILTSPLPGGRLEIEPGQARQIAAILRRASDSFDLPARPTAEAALLGDAAGRAADADETWTWRTT